MEKIGVITLFGTYNNYGNRLQNYAVHQLLMKEGFQPETILWQKRRGKEWLKSIRCVFGAIARRPKYIRELRFRKFDKETIRRKTYYCKNEILPDSISQKYAFFVVGSDQVWNPEVRKDQKSNFFLRFCKREQRIALCPSYALDSMPTGCETEYKIGLQGFPFLSCREKNGAEILSLLANKQCENLIDPTLALDGNEWRRFQKRIILPDRYAVVFFLGEISSDIRSKIAQYAAEIKCEVLEPSSLKDRYYTIDPREFVYLIGNADIVFTDSFHAIAFSINLNVPFYAFERHQDFEEYEHMMSRIHSLLQLTGLSSRIYDSNEKLNKDCNFEISNSILENERVRLRQYLKRSLAQKDLKPFGLPDGSCIGCGVCAERCMTDSIVMQTDGEGFLRPVFKTDACVNCGVCLQVCPVLNNHYLKKDEEKRILYAAFQKDKEQLINSSSGAVFPLLADYVIGRGGVVYGAAFTDNFEVEHIRVDDKETVKRLRGSKYVQSTAYKIFKMVDEDIRKQKEVLFIGTPCQVGALKSFLGEERTDLTNLYTVDFVCHGVPSPGIWKSFLKGVKNTYLNGEDIHEISFRQKERITGPIHILVIKSNGSIYRSDSLHDPFYRAFLNNVSLRPSCYDCHFKGIKRNCDLTIGDFWGIEEIRPDASGEWGTSLVIIQTKKGTDLFQNVVHDLNATEINLSEIVGKHNLSLTESCQEHPCRRQFFNATALDFQNRADLYCIPVRRSLQKRIINKINKILSVKS